MRNLFSKKSIENLSTQQKDLYLGLLIILAIAVIYYFQWAYYLTGLEDSKVNLEEPARFFWWANDSRSYRAAGEWLFGRSDILSIEHRPWLYPLLLGLAGTLFAGAAESFVWLLQFLMWLGSGALIYLSIQNTTRSTVLAMLSAGVFFSHPSPLILTFHGMTEMLNILLISTFCWVLTSSLRNRIRYAIVLIALATVTKPIYLLFLILLVLYGIFRYRERPGLRQAVWVAVLLLPIWIQLVLSMIATGRPTISSIGGYTFKNYLVADVYLRTEGTDWRETTALIEDWDVQQQLSYLWDHQRMTLLTVREHLIDSNLLTGSFFALGEGNRLRDFSTTLNVVAAYVHLLMLPLVVYYLLSPKYRPHRETIALLYACFVLQWLTSGISTGQDDRLMITALPLWITVYFSVVRGLNTPPTAGSTIESNQGGYQHT